MIRLALALSLAVALPAVAADKAPTRRIELTVTDKGFEPTPVKVAKGEPVTLVVTRKTERTCARDIVVKDYDVRAKLPMNTPVEVTFTPTKAGELKYGCAMGQMISGILLVE